MNKKKIFSLSILLHTAILAWAQHDAHEHGVAEMQIIIENTHAEIVLHIPGSDFIGFEHKNLNEEEKKLIHNTIESLEQSDSDLISFRTMNRMEVHLDELHVNDEEHREEQGDEDLHLDDAEHAEYELHFNYSMEDSSKLRDLELESLFRAFPTLSEIHWIMINSFEQSAGEATPSDSRIRL